MRILIVDDDPVCRQALTMYLTLLGDIDAVGSGEAALSAIQQALAERRPYGLVFLDIRMPGRDGHSVLEELRRLEHAAGFAGLAGARVVMVTGIDEPRQVVRAFRAQADGYLVKPVELPRLRQLLKDLGVLGSAV
ncbi:MAG: response regulator [Planctomycetota bacterium]|nr:response regulator [Planctomycetota bacterium]MDW8372772.1 response regulator [Planctomycetota bacterium]